MWKACCSVRSGDLDAEAFAEAVWHHYSSRPPLGKLAMKMGLLSMNQVFTVLNEQAMHGLPFGESAIKCGLMTHEQLATALLLQEELATSVEDILVKKGELSEEYGSPAERNDNRAVGQTNRIANVGGMFHARRDGRQGLKQIAVPSM